MTYTPPTPTIGETYRLKNPDFPEYARVVDITAEWSGGNLDPDETEIGYLPIIDGHEQPTRYTTLRTFRSAYNITEPHQEPEPKPDDILGIREGETYPAKNPDQLRDAAHVIRIRHLPYMDGDGTTAIVDYTYVLKGELTEPASMIAGLFVKTFTVPEPNKTENGPQTATQDPSQAEKPDPDTYAAQPGLTYPAHTTDTMTAHVIRTGRNADGTGEPIIEYDSIHTSTGSCGRLTKPLSEFTKLYETSRTTAVKPDTKERKTLTVYLADGRTHRLYLDDTCDRLRADEHTLQTVIRAWTSGLMNAHKGHASAYMTIVNTNGQYAVINAAQIVSIEPDWNEPHPNDPELS